MNANHVESKFAMMGARLKVSVLSERQRVSEDYAIDIQKDRQGEYFELRVPEPLQNRLDVNVLQTDKRDRHLLLFVRPPEGKPARFLCGHDEREWFVAAVPGGASTVVQAKEALKPRAIRTLQTELQVPTRLRNRRKNAAFRRQGECFFVPVRVWQRDQINEKFILQNEPLRRGTGKPHIVEQLYRVAGELIYVCPKYPNGVSEMQYQRMIKQDRKAAQSARVCTRSGPSS